jgi:hypothetical protein
LPARQHEYFLTVPAAERSADFLSAAFEAACSP